MTFTEAVMDKYDAPQLAIDANYGMADTDYGPRGPRSRPGSSSEPDPRDDPGGSVCGYAGELPPPRSRFVTSCFERGGRGSSCPADDGMTA